jgi:two-component system response regulator AtoC
MKSLKILIVDDESELRKNLISLLKNNLSEFHIQALEAENGLKALEMIHAHSFDLVLMDVKMPEMNGLDALAKIKEHDPRIMVVIMTAHSNLNDAVTAIRDGAYDYVEKPVQIEKLTQMIHKSIEARALVAGLTLSNPIFDDDIESSYNHKRDSEPDADFVGQSSKMREVFSLIYKLCKVETTVLIRGENGTGKELVAKAIHFNSYRKDGDFIAINCGAIPENLMESELFGHEKGSFTGANERKIGKFQLANNGTLFLDEIGELRLDLQVKLLRVLQEKKFVPVGGQREIKSNARIIAATNRNLEKMIEQNEFREDLFYRLNVMPIFLPPLRERTDDIAALVQHFIKKLSTSHKSQIHGIRPEALKLLKGYRWPGNIRELENIIERAFILENGSEITESVLPDAIRNLKSNTQDQDTTSNKNLQNAQDFDFETFKEESEKEFIINALRANKGKINQTVARANIPKNTLLRKIKKYGINVKEFGEDS